MSTNRKIMRFTSVLLLACAGMAWSPASATTENETAMVNSPLPHEKLGKGRESVKVHWVRLQGYVDGKAGHAALLNELKALVQRCVKAPLGGQSRPPRVWPDYVESTQSDTYEAANRSITYWTTLSYGVNPNDCSLLETRGQKAQLASTKGFCEIDFVHKTAHGVCDAQAHGDAPAVVRIAPQGPAGRARAGATNASYQAAVAATEKAMGQFGPVRTGERKTIVGIECDVQAIPLSGTVCLSHGGTFPEWKAHPGATGANLELELTNVAGVSARAVKAQLDATVNAAVFAPYLADGFQVTNIQRRK
jgi:hypothetical protein